MPSARTARRALLAAAIVGCAVAPASAAAASQWHQESRFPYSVWGAGAGHLSGSGDVLVAGGFGFDLNRAYKPVSSTFVATDRPGLRSWSRAKGLPAPRAGAGTAEGSDGDIYMVGGTGTGNAVLASVVRHGPDAEGGWGRSVAPLLYPRTDLAAVGTTDGRIFAIGGYAKLPAGFLPTVTVQVYNIASNTWSLGPPLPSARGGLAATLGADGKIYVFGGWNGVQRRETFVLDPGHMGDGWTQLADMPAPHEVPAAVTGSGGALYVIGGWDGHHDLSRVEAYHPASDTWTCTVPLSTGRSWPAAFASSWGMETLGGLNGRTLQRSYEFIRWGELATGDSAPPVVTSPPTAHIPAGTAGTLGMPINVVWGASDAKTDILAQHLQVSVDGGTTWTAVSGGWPVLEPFYIPHVVSLPNVRYRVAPTDCGGNTAAPDTGAAFSTRVAGEASLRYAGHWSLGTSSTYQGGHDRYATAAGARARFDFTGREVAWLAPTSSLRGAAHVFIDGKLSANVSLYSKALVGRSIVWRHQFTRAGTHYVTIQVVGTKGHPRVDVDGFFVIDAPRSLPGGATDAEHVDEASASVGGVPDPQRSSRTATP